MAAIPTAEAIGAKWAKVTPGRVAEYAAGVQQPTRNWQNETLAAAGSFQAGIQAAITNKSFEKGVTRAGNASWQRGAVEKGTQRFGPGVQVAQDRYTRAFAPFRAVIAALVLPPRFARRDARNLDRVRVVAEALGKAKQLATS